MNKSKTFQVEELTVSGFPFREGQAVAYTALGFSSKEAAKRMHCSPRNVDNLKEAAKDRLLAANTPHLIAKSFHKGNLTFKALCLVLFFSFNFVVELQQDDQQRAPSRSTRFRRRGPTSPIRISTRGKA